MDHFKFVQNRKCEFFPCHSGVREEDFNCLFCYCPLYALGDRCGGCYSYTQKGIKDCSSCVRPHIRDNYDDIIGRMEAILELAKKQDEAVENP